MRVIAHRGNLDGPCPNENIPKVIDTVLSLGFDVEIDLWKFGSFLWLGHDTPTYTVTERWICEDAERKWIHCKNLEALDWCLYSSYIYEAFWHQDDMFTLTKGGYIWTFPHQEVTSKSIICISSVPRIIDKCYGVCTDYPFVAKGFIEL